MKTLATAVVLAILAFGAAGSAASQPPLKAFPGAQGWAADTAGGRGGQVIRVTNLNTSGPGSFRAAVDAKGPRIVVFEVGGAIDLGGQTLTIREPFLMIAGQTAPSPGITLIRGGLDLATHDAVIQHIRIRAGEAGYAKKSSHDFDSFSTQGVSYNVIVDHCTLTWGTDENLSASGPRFVGDTPEQWRAGTSRKITFSNNIIAESLKYATHAKIEHSKGSLIHDNVNDILIVGNLYAHNYERNPLFKGGVHGVIVNNLIYNPGPRVVHYNLMAEEWAGHAYQTGQIVAVGNVYMGGLNTPPKTPFMQIGGYGDVQFYGADNIAVDRFGSAMPMFGRYTTSTAKIIVLKAPPVWPAGLKAMPSNQVQKSVLANVGARPWDRDADDVRLIADVAEGRGEHINSESDLHGYPQQPMTRRPFVEADWDLRFMTPTRPELLDSGAKARGT